MIVGDGVDVHVVVVVVVGGCGHGRGVHDDL